MTADETDHARQAVLARASAGALLGPADMAVIYGFSLAHFYRLNKQGTFDFLKVRPPLGPKCFSGVLVSRHVSGELVYEPTFGRKRRSA
jgi:hypothetical protein